MATGRPITAAATAMAMERPITAVATGHPIMAAAAVAAAAAVVGDKAGQGGAKHGIAPAGAGADCSLVNETKVHLGLGEPAYRKIERIPLRAAICLRPQA